MTALLLWLACGKSEEPPANVPDPPTVSEETASTADTSESIPPTGETSDTGTAPTGGRSYRKLSAGELLTCGLLDDGEISCIGSTPWSVPAAPPGPFVDVVASWDTACGVRESGELVCWGCDWTAELCEAPSGSDWVAIDAASDFFCAQDQAGGVSCWNYGGPLPPPYGPDPDEAYANYEGPPLPGSLAQIDGYEQNFCWLDTDGKVGCVRRPPDAVRVLLAP